MSFNPSELSEQTLKRFVDRLARFYKKQPRPESWPPKRHQCQEMIAAALGFQHWNEAISTIKRPPSHVDFYDHMRDGMSSVEPLTVVETPNELDDGMDFRDLKAFYEHDGLIVITGGTSATRQLFMRDIGGFFERRKRRESTVIWIYDKDGMEEKQRLPSESNLDEKIHILPNPHVFLYNEIQVDHSNQLTQFKEILNKSNHGLTILSMEEDIHEITELKSLINSKLRLTIDVNEFPHHSPVFKINYRRFINTPLL